MPTSRKSSQETLYFTLGERHIPVHVRRRKRQKYIRLRISGRGEVNLSAPQTKTKKELRNALSEKRSWIERHVEEIVQRFEEVNPLRRVLYRGEVYPVYYKERENERILVRINEQEHFLAVYLPASGLSQDPGQNKLIEAAIARWFRGKASQHIRPRVAHMAEELGFSFNKLYIRNQKTRWGSSSSIGNISINWRAVMAPLEVQRYLIIHELSHQLYLNHSGRFWNEVERHCPDYRLHETWLKEHRELMALFR